MRVHSDHLAEPVTLCDVREADRRPPLEAADLDDGAGRGRGDRGEHEKPGLRLGQVTGGVADVPPPFVTRGGEVVRDHVPVCARACYRTTVSESSPRVVVVTPVRNEAWILDRFLAVASRFAERIIVADQRSTDDSRAICARRSEEHTSELQSQFHLVCRLLLEKKKKKKKEASE